jgi:hypothetical protein
VVALRAINSTDGRVGEPPTTWFEGRRSIDRNFMIL